MSEEVFLSVPPKRILLPRFDTIGDIVLVEGFVESLMHRFPQAQLTFLTRQVYADLASLFPDGIEWLTTEMDPHKQPADFSSCKKLLNDLNSTWDLVLITAHNRTWADDLVAISMKSSVRVGVGLWTEVQQDFSDTLQRLGLNRDCPYDLLVSVDEKSHEVDKYRALQQDLIGDPEIPEPKLRINEHQKTAAGSLLRHLGLEGTLLCVCAPVGTQKVSIKTWQPQKFGEVIAWLEAKHGIRSLVTSHQSEAACASEVVRIAREKGANPGQWIGRDGEIPILAALLEKAELYLGNDTGPMHIAAAVNTPVLGIFGGGTWPRFIPRGSRSIAVTGCMPCYGCGWDCIFGDAPCMELVRVEDVKQAVDYLLEPLSEGGPRVFNASTILSPETSRYIENAVKSRLSLRQDISRLVALLRESEADRAARLKEIEHLGKQLDESEADRKARLSEIEKLGQKLAESDADRAARLEQIDRLGNQLDESEKDRAARLDEINRLGKALAESEADRAARLREIERLGRQLAEIEAQRAAQLPVMQRMERQIAELDKIVGVPIVRGLSKLGIIRKRSTF